MDRHDRKPKKDRTSELDPDLMSHIQSLGLISVEDYISWCAQHGFSRPTEKHFWITVLQFFIANPMLDLAQVGPIIDYINNQRFEQQSVFVAPGVVGRRGPAQPNFTMKGRTPASVLRPDFSSASFFCTMSSDRNFTSPRTRAA